MKLLPIFILIFAASGSAQSSLPIGPKVNGVGLDARYAEVMRKLGKPIKQVTDRNLDECTGSHIRTLYYPGLKIELFDAEKNVYKVFAMEVTSAKWDVSGSRVGDASAKIQKLFGTRGRTMEKDSAGTIWYYEMNEAAPGLSNFHFRNARLVKIYFGYTMC